MRTYDINRQRRDLLKLPLAAAALAAASVGNLRAASAPDAGSTSPTRPAANVSDKTKTPAELGWSMPSELHPHKRCWMAWPARTEVWRKQLDAVRRDIARLAQSIASFEPVSMLVHPGQEAGARNLCGAGVEIVSMPVDDMWLRDSGPVFLTDGRGHLAGSMFNFNGWGGKQMHERDGQVAAALLAHLQLPVFQAPMVAEGGALEADGEGTLLVVEPSIDNSNRNRGLSRDELTRRLCGWLGVEKVLWVPDSKPDYWTDGHIDGVARFVKPGVVLVDAALPEAVEFLRNASDARQRKLTVIELPRPAKRAGQPHFCDCYLNFYAANGAIIMPWFGQAEADQMAKEVIAKAYPERKIVTLQLDAIAAGGGLMHCVTQQEPAV